MEMEHQVIGDFFSPIFIAPSVIKVNYFSITEFPVEPGTSLTNG